MSITDDDDAIVENLLLIREGLLNKDFSKILEGYNNITGEDLIIETKTKSEKIKEKFQQKLNKTKVKKDMPMTDSDEVDLTDEESENQSVIEKNIGGMKVITSRVILKEKKKNEKLVKTIPPTERVKRNTELKNLQTSNENAEFRAK